MVFGWFKKKNKDPVHDHVLDLHDKFGSLNSSLNDSFTKIQKDMNKIKNHTDYAHDRHDHHDEVLQNMMMRISRLEEYMKALAEQKVGEEYEEELEVPEPSYSKSDMDQLTEAQQRIMMGLMALQNENPDEWISMKYLAQEVYPDKAYSSVRSTLSQFITSLEEMGLIKRKRKGKQAYVILAKKVQKQRRMPSKATLKIRKKKKYQS